MSLYGPFAATTVLPIDYIEVVLFVERNSWEGYLCGCSTCRQPPCTSCIVHDTQPHSKCLLHLWNARGRECNPESPCHGCLKYIEVHPEFMTKLKRLHKDRCAMRRKRGTDTPITITRQEDSENEFMAEVEGDLLADVPSLLSDLESGDDVTGASISKLQDNFPRVAYTGNYRSCNYCQFLLRRC